MLRGGYVHRTSLRTMTYLTKFTDPPTGVRRFSIRGGVNYCSIMRGTTHGKTKLCTKRRLLYFNQNGDLRKLRVSRIFKPDTKTQRCTVHTNTHTNCTSLVGIIPSQKVQFPYIIPRGTSKAAVVRIKSKNRPRKCTDNRCQISMTNLKGLRSSRIQDAIDRL